MQPRRVGMVPLSSPCAGIQPLRLTRRRQTSASCRRAAFRQEKRQRSELAGHLGRQDVASGLSWLQEWRGMASTCGWHLLCCGIFTHPAAAEVTLPAVFMMSDVQSFLLSPAVQGVLSAFLLVLFSEIGDKTFFVALLLSLQNSKAAVFTGTFGALVTMTLISVGLGQALHQIDAHIPAEVASFPFDDFLAVGLLLWFGILTLKSAPEAESNSAAEQAEAEEGVKSLIMGSGGLVLSTFLLVFSAEWGDKSFLATTALSAASSPQGVAVGAIAGHFVATLLAVLGGSVLSPYLSQRTLQYIGGSLFLTFAAATSVDLAKHFTP